MLDLNPTATLLNEFAHEMRSYDVVQARVTGDPTLTTIKPGNLFGRVRCYAFNDPLQVEVLLDLHRLMQTQDGKLSPHQLAQLCDHWDQAGT